MKENRIIVAGGRKFSNAGLLARKLDHLTKNLAIENMAIVSGCAAGADTLGAEWARARGIEVIEYPAEWDRLGKRAGYIRNEEMAKVATHLVAFWDGESRGTKHMIDLSNQYGLRVVVVRF